MEEAIQYAKRRVAFGQPISHCEVIRFMIADMSSHIEAARLLLRKPPFSATGAGLTPREAEDSHFQAFLKIKGAKSSRIQGGQEHQ